MDVGGSVGGVLAQLPGAGMDSMSSEEGMDYDSAWDDVQNVFGLDGRQMSAQEEVPVETVAFLFREDLLKGVLDYLQAELEFRLRNDVVPAFWAFFSRQQQPSSEDSSEVDLFAKAVTDLYVRVSDLVPFVQRMDRLTKVDLESLAVAEFGQTNYVDLFKLLLKATLHSQLPPDFSAPIEAFYTKAFHVFHTQQEKEAQQALDDSSCSNNTTAGGGGGGGGGSEMVAGESCEGCQKVLESPSVGAGAIGERSLGDWCECALVMSIFHDVDRKLLEMDILDRLTSDVITKIVKGKISSHVNESCQGSFTVSHLRPLEEWLDNVVMRWIRMLYTGASSSGGGLDHDLVLTSFRQRLCHFLYETYTVARIDQLFNVIIEFPESAPALEDVKECLAKTDLRSRLTRSLKRVLQKKLLHVGVNTADILTAYIAAIRALRVLDPSGVLLELVCEPVRRYLRTRDDTVRCIVSSLIDDSSSELAEELTKNEGLCLDESIFNDVGEGGGDPADAEELEATWEHWQPDPIDAAAPATGGYGMSGGGGGSSACSRRRRSSDIISMLVNIYGSKELFVNEYRSLLSNRLLSQFSYETEKEIRNLELLKLRFGEAPLHQCEVMLKDVGDSKRINTALHQENQEGAEPSAGQLLLRNNEFPVNALILSAQFWPQFKATETLALPRVVQDSLDCYTKAFEAMKGNRTLAWKHHLGLANIELSMGDKKMNLTVSPVHAAIIHQFTEQSEWTAEDLAASLKMPVSTLRRKMAFWQTQGLIKELPNNQTYALIEESPMRRMSGVGGDGMGGVGGVGGVVGEDDESESATRTSSDQRAEELQVFWSYIVNMLINLESLPLERIFQMLKMFAMVHGGGGGGGGGGGVGGQGGASECKIDALRAFLDEKVRQHELVFSAGQYKLPKS